MKKNQKVPPFWDNVVKSPTCWHWIGRQSNNYGSYFKKRAHRVALEEALGRELRPNCIARHTCRVTTCVNPAHLIETEYISGLDDRHCDTIYAPGSKLNNHEITEIRASTEPCNVLADKYGLSRSAMYDIINFKSYSFIN
jgi:hypothetical protein